MTDLFESKLTEALHRRADERLSPAPSLAELHHRAQTTGPAPKAPVPGFGSRLLLGGVLAGLFALAVFGGVQAFTGDDTTLLVDPADDGPVEVDPNDPLTWPVDDGSPEQFRRGSNGEIATFEGEVLNDQVDVFLDGWFIATWDDTDKTWDRPMAEPGSGIETGPGKSIGDDLTVVSDVPANLATEECAIPGQETWMMSGPGVDGLHIYADRPELENLLPRPVVEISAQPDHVADVADVLAGTGLEPNITRVLQLDIEGDGVDEVIIEANTLNGRSDFTGGGEDYSLLLLRRVGVGGAVETIRIHESIGETGQPYLLWMTVAAVADVNSDGTFELATREDYFEGFAKSVWSLDGTPERLAQGGCGA